MTGALVAPAVMAKNIDFSQWWSNGSMRFDSSTNSKFTDTVKQTNDQKDNGKKTDDANLHKDVHITKVTNTSNQSDEHTVITSSGNNTANNSNNHSNVQVNISSGNNTNHQSFQMNIDSNDSNGKKLQNVKTSNVSIHTSSISETSH